MKNQPPKISDRVKLICVDRFPDFLIQSTPEKPVYGTVVHVGQENSPDDYEISVKLDDHYDKLNEWNNEIFWANCPCQTVSGEWLTTLDIFWEECELVD